MRGAHPSIGVSLSDVRVLAVRLDETGSRAPLIDESWDAREPSRATALRTMLESLRQQMGRHAVLHVALLPPLAEIRLVQLPPLESDDLRAVVAPDAARYLPVGATRQVVQVDGPHESKPGSARHVVSFADAGLLDEIIEVASVSGWEVGSIGTASHAWVRAARAQGAATGSGIIVRHGSREDRLRLAATGIAESRRRQVTFEKPSPGERLIAGDALTAHLLAAQYATAPDDQCLWPEQLRARRRAASWTRTKWFVAAAALILMTAGVAEWRSLRRDSARVATERRAIAPQVTSAMSRRDSLASIERALGHAYEFESAAPRWLGLLATLEAALPEDASLLSIRGGGDTLTLIGRAERAAPVLEAIGRVPDFRDVRADAPIRQEVEDGEVVGEHFTLVLRTKRREETP